MPSPALPLCMIVVGLGLAGCADEPPGRNATDDLPHRAVVLAPSAAEMLEALGVLDQVVGTGDFGPWPDTLTELPSVGGYDAPNVERLLELNCDLLITTRSEAAIDAHRRLERLGIGVEALDTSTYDGVYEALSRLGEIFDRREAAEAVRSGMTEALEALASAAAGLTPRRVLVVVGRDPLFVAGPGSHVDEMIRIAGGSNVAHDALAPYQRISLEAILERLPEVIIDASDNRPGALRGCEPGAWGEWEFLPAVNQGRVCWVDPGLLLIPGIRLPEMTRLMARLIHPETFGGVGEADLRLPSADPGSEG